MGKIKSIKILSTFFLLMFGIAVSGWGQVAGDFQPKNTVGNWSDFNNWNIHNGITWNAAITGQIPNAATAIYFASSRTINVDINTAACKHIYLATAGITEKFTFAASSILTVFGSLYQIHPDNIPFTNFGIGAKIIFAGSSNQTITNSGLNTNLYNVEINKSGGTFAFPTANTKYDAITLTAGIVEGVGAGLVGSSSAATITINAGTWTQSSGSNVINAGAGIAIPLIVNGGTMVLGTSSANGFSFSSMNVTNNGTLTMNQVSGGSFVINDALSVDATSTLNTDFVTTPAPVSLVAINFDGTVNYTKNGSQNLINAAYNNLGLSGMLNKNPIANLMVTGDLNITGGAAIFQLGTFNLSIGGNWTNWGSGGFSEGSSTVDFIGSGAQSINNIAGREDFFIIKKSGLGILTLNANVSAGGTGSGLNISSGILDAGTNMLSGTSSSNFIMTGGLLKLAKLTTNLPEFTGAYSLSGGTIELNGNGDQQFKGSNSYKNLTFSNSGTKSLTSSITNTNTITGIVLISGAVILNVSNYTFGGPGTNLTMTGTSRYITAGTSTKPDATGTYSLALGTTVEFSNMAATVEEIRITSSYASIVVSGSSVANSSIASTPLNIQAGGSFTVTNTGTFKHMNVNGFCGAANTSISITNNPTINIQDGSTIEYYRADGNPQTISSAINIGQGSTGNYYSLKLSGSGNKTAASTLEIKGNLTGAGTATFLHNSGTVLMNGIAGQVYTSTTTFPFCNLTNNSTLGGGGFTINSNLSVEKELKLNTLSAIKLNTGDIILKSTLTNTANIAAVPDEPTIIQYTSGRFNIERYLYAQKSWRLLSTPVLKYADDATTPTINDSWREGGTSLTANGYGTRVTGPGTVAFPGGVDETTQRGSMKSYNMALNNYVEITAANLAATKTIANDEGYYIFVRGDRGVDVPGGATGITTLRMKGKIRSGDQTFSVNAGAYQCVGNPFPSRIQFSSTTKTSIEDAFIIWNPTNSGGGYGVGRFEQYANNAGNYTGSFGTRNFIESGEAFFISTSGGAGSIAIKESDKTTSSANVSRVAATTPTLEINLFAKANDNTDYKADGTFLNFDAGFSNSINNQDVKKFENSADNISIRSNSYKLFAERRIPLQTTDTIFLSLTNTRVASYHFKIDPSVLGDLRLNAFLIDKFLLTETGVSLTAVTIVPFGITGDAASSLEDRFKIVFRQTSVPLPVTFTNIIAVANANKTNTIKWIISNEINLKSYSVERSASGIRFYTISNVGVTGNTVYKFMDAAPIAALNYYRIKAISTNGQLQYSAIAKVNSVAVLPAFTIQPNPVLNKTLYINFENMVGFFNLTLTNKVGATVFSKQLFISAENEVKNMKLSDAIVAGLYEVLLINAKGKQFVQTIFIK